MAQLQMDTSYELMRACRATPLAADGSEQPEEELSPGHELALVEERGDRLLVRSAGTASMGEWQYLVRREEFEAAITPPEQLPRVGQAPTTSSNTAGSPD